MKSISVIITFLSLIFSQGFKESFKYLKSEITGSKNWSKDLSKFKGRFKIFEKEKTELYLGSIIGEIRNHHWSDDAIRNTELVFRETVRNALTHGLKDNSNKEIEIKTELTPNYIEFRVKDPGIGFNLNEELIKQGVFSSKGNNLKGIAVTYRTATKLTQVNIGIEHIITVLYKKNHHPITISDDLGITVINLSGEIDDDTNDWKITVERIKELNTDDRVILNFGEPAFFNYSRSAFGILYPFIGEYKKLENVAVANYHNSSKLMQEYLIKNFKCFDNYDDAKNYLLCIIGDH